jgi:dienelactone hydrolase
MKLTTLGYRLLFSSVLPMAGAPMVIAMQPARTPHEDATTNADAIVLPEVSGRHAIGYRAAVLTDDNREEFLTDDWADNRRLLIEFWYPADVSAGTKTKPYMSEEVARAWSQRHPLPEGFHERVRTHSVEGADLIDVPNRLPVLVFSHGMTFPPQNYQSIFEDLASHGYVIAAVNHSYALNKIVFPNGEGIEWGLWEPDDFASEDDRQRALATHLSTWIADIRFVIDALQQSDEHGIDFLEGRLATTNVGVFGHSYGGTAAAYVLHADPRVVAAAAMEGAIYAEEDRPLQVNKPFLYFIGGYNIEDNSGEYQAGNGPYYQVVVERAMHVAFGDLLLVYQHFADEGWRQRRKSDTPPERVAKITQAYLRAFFDRYVRGESGALLDESTTHFPESTLRVVSAKKDETASAAGGTASHYWAGHWVGKLARQGQAYTIVMDITGSDQTPTVTVDLPDYSIYGWPTAFSVEGANATVSPHLVSWSLNLTRKDDRLTGKSTLLDVQSDVLLERTAVPPRKYVEEELSFRSKDAVLAGTFVKPHGPGPFPAVVWTHGSGPDTRATPHYHGKAHLLAQHGVASLIYDKRGAGTSTGDSAWNLELLTADAIAGIEAIENRSDVDSTRVGIAGFSQGGWVAPMVAAQCDAVDFLVSGATPGVTGGDQNVFSLMTRLERAGYDDETVKAASGLLVRLYRYYQDGSGRDEVAKELEAAKEKPWFHEAIFQRLLFLPGEDLPEGGHPYWKPHTPDPSEVWTQVRVPVLAMWGALDGNVPVERSKEVIQTALLEAGNTDFELLVFPQAGHGIWLEREADAPWDWPRQAPGYHAAIVQWVSEHIGKHDN